GVGGCSTPPNTQFSDGFLMNPRNIDVMKSADLIVRRLLAVQPGENVMIICDPGSEMSMASALAGIVESVGAEYTIALRPTREKDRANDLTPMIEKGLEAADCMIGMTRFSGAPTYSKAVKARYKAKKLRTISMVMRDLDNFTRGGALADYDALYAEGKRLSAVWDQVTEIRVTNPAGTDICATIGNAKSIVECGFATEPGLEAAFSDGEVSQGPNEGTSEGVIVVDGPICYLGLPDEPVRLHVSGGRVTKVEGNGRTASELRRIVETIANAGNIAEFGIGLNGWSLRNGDFEEEKKGRGNVHIALGDNIFYGGTTHSSVHIDMVLYKSTVSLGDQVVVENGKVQLPE
ncbi:MAG: aminopeptidase, partial [Anaerolineales bacterium]